MKTIPRTQFGNPILRAKAKKVPVTFLQTTGFKSLIRSMFHTMRQANGVGLAAPQINKDLSIAVIGIRPFNFKRVIINPQIVWHSRNMIKDWEGCLSFSGIRGNVPRWQTIKVRYTNEKGERITEIHKDFVARVFQHEIDHLNGIVYVDRMTDMKTLMTQKEFIKRVLN